MSDSSDRAANLEQQYVQEYEQTEEVLTGLDPEKSEQDQTKQQVEGVAKDSDAAEHVEKMSRNDP